MFGVVLGKTFTMCLKELKELLNLEDRVRNSKGIHK